MCTRVTLLLALCGTALSIINIKTDDSGLKECLQICTGRSAEGMTSLLYIIIISETQL